MKGRYSIDNFNLLLDYDPQLDIYPLLKHTDMMITDYSSIYFDYLLLDKPIIFYPYDFEQYTKDDRNLLFDYESMTPGPHCQDQTSLEKTILQELENSGRNFSKQRGNPLCCHGCLDAEYGWI